MTPTKLLLVDDDESNRVTLSALLEEEGFDVQTAASFAQARDRIAGAEFDGILLDQNLGDGKGTELLPLIRQQQPRAKVVLISGSVDEPKVVGRGFDARVGKGAAFPDVLALVHRVVGPHR